MTTSSSIITDALWPAIFNGLLIMWPLIALLVIMIIAYVVFDLWSYRNKFKKGEAWRTDRDLLQWLRGMKPKEFEEYIADLFTRLGYSAQAVGKSHDGGVDVVVEKDGMTSYIQCKKFITQKVPVGAVRDFYGALADHLANGKGFFITTNSFTLEATKFAEDKPIELIDGFGLVKYIKLAKANNDVLQGKASVNLVCPSCGGKLLERTGKFGEFYGCENYPECKFTMKKTDH